MKSRSTTFMILTGIILSSLIWQAVPVQQSEIAQAQTTTDPRIVRPGIEPVYEFLRVLQAVHQNSYSISVKDQAPYALPADNSLNNNTWNPQYFKSIHMDMNADGLTDMIYSGPTPIFIGSGSPAPNGLQNTQLVQYVMLNTGSGFKMAYICKRDSVYIGNNVYENRYFGDCAQ